MPNANAISWLEGGELGCLNKSCQVPPLHQCLEEYLENTSCLMNKAGRRHKKLKSACR